MLCFVRMTPATLGWLLHPRANLLLQWKIVWEKVPTGCSGGETHQTRSISNRHKPRGWVLRGFGNIIVALAAFESGDWSSVGWHVVIETLQNQFCEESLRVKS